MLFVHIPIALSLSFSLIRRNFSSSFSFRTCLAVAKTHGAPLFSVNVKNLFNLRVIEIKRNFKQYKLVAGLNAQHMCVRCTYLYHIHKW